MIKNIIFDFDGVILDSVPTKTEGFKKLFQDFPNEKVDKLIEYHLQNGGMSRYKKIKYFFSELMNHNISEDKVLYYANKYSEITKGELINLKYIIEDTVNFIKQNHKKYNMHIASGADEKDLKYICDKLVIAHYFKTIHGSPTEKEQILKNILDHNAYKTDETIFIGDSINDFEAATANNIKFCGFRNIRLKKYTKCYINSFKEFRKILLL